MGHKSQAAQPVRRLWSSSMIWSMSRAKAATSEQPPIPPQTAAPPATLTHDPLAATQATSENPTNQSSPAEERFALALTRIVMLLARCPAYQTMTLREIEQRVMPPLLHGQYAIMDATVAGRKVTAAAAFWALVSPDVDARLSDPTNPQKTLCPHEWRSGDIAWLIDCVGDPKAVPMLVDQLHNTAFKGRELNSIADRLHN